VSGGVPGAAAVARASARHPGLALVVLFGSRARGDSGERSDWDVGYIGRIDADQFLLDLVTALGAERIDVVDLERAAGLLRYRAARDGVPVFEATAGAFARFWLEAVSFWCDAYPVLRAGYAELLAETGP
jgi:predicted nucleotidyltransferase